MGVDLEVWGGKCIRMIPHIRQETPPLWFAIWPSSNLKDKVYGSLGLLCFLWCAWKCHWNWCPKKPCAPSSGMILDSNLPGISHQKRRSLLPCNALLCSSLCIWFFETRKRMNPTLTQAPITFPNFLIFLQNLPVLVSSKQRHFSGIRQSSQLEEWDVLILNLTTATTHSAWEERLRAF